MNTNETLGTRLSIGSYVIAEVAAVAGFDLGLLDLEHGGGAKDAVAEPLLAGRFAKLSINCIATARTASTANTHSSDFCNGLSANGRVITRAEVRSWLLVRRLR